MRRLLREFHGSEKGAISVLVILTIWCLIAALGMVWNSSEVAVRRQTMQTAADSAAHSVATWVTRTVNAVAAENMVIGQDASTEVIWRAIPPADRRIRRELEAELERINQMIANNDPAYNQRRNALLRLLRDVDNEYALVQAGLTTVTASAGSVTFPTPQDKTDFQTELRQAGEALEWVNDTYVGGAQPSVAGRPGPPGANGEGLRELVAKWSNTPLTLEMLQVIRDSLLQQLGVLQQFEDRTQNAVNQDVGGQIAEHEAQVFNHEQQRVNMLPQVVAEQQAQIASEYKTDVAVGAPERPTNAASQQQVARGSVAAPIVPATDIETFGAHTDSIRTQYPDLAAQAGLIPVVDIDPINPHTQDARIWHPNLTATVPADLRAQYPGINQQFTVDCNYPGGWGHSWAFPLERYVSSRIWKDQSTINTTYMEVIDRLRQELAQTLNRMRGLDQTGNLRGLPPRIVDSQNDAQGQPQFIPVLPTIQAPTGATAQFRSEVTVYNQHAGAYTGAVRRLAGALSSFAAYFNDFTRPFAVDTWHNEVSNERFVVLQELGTAKGFMVLATYKLREIPSWAQSGMRDSATVAVHDEIMRRNINPVSNNVLNALVAADPRNYGAGFADPQARRQFLRAMYSGDASIIARRIIDEVATQASPAIAREMVSRPWPYEITPPEDVVPPSRGMSKEDRRTYFSVVATARQTQDTAPRLLLTKIFGQPDGTLITYAQGETFNWMEFNNDYGGSEWFDQVAPDGYGGILACPRAWRLSTVGGWNWQPRLALSDALAPTIQANSEIAGYMNQAGITTGNEQNLDVVNLH